MTREMQDTERALQRAEQDWLLARGWSASGAAVRWSHHAAPSARPDYARRDALAMTRAEPLRYTARRNTTAGPA